MGKFPVPAADPLVAQYKHTLRQNAHKFYTE